MNTPLTISVLTNAFFYVVIACLLFKMFTTDTANEKPLPDDQLEGYHKFCAVIAAIWPLSMLFMLIDESFD